MATLLPRLGLEPADVGAKFRLGAFVGGLPLGAPVLRHLGPGAVGHGARLVGTNRTFPDQFVQMAIIDQATRGTDPSQPGDGWR